MAPLVARFAPVLVAALLAGAASPGGNAPLTIYAPALPLPLVVTPRQPPPASVARPVFLPAPVPDLELDDNSLRKTGPAQVELTPNLFHPQQTFWGDGYTPHSTVEDQQNGKLRPMPGLNLSVPLE